MYAMHIEEIKILNPIIIGVFAMMIETKDAINTDITKFDIYLYKNWTCFVNFKGLCEPFT